MISGCVGVVGFWAYTFEMLQDRITRFTRWRDLNHYQLELTVMMVGGVIIFLSALILGAMFRSVA